MFDPAQITDLAYLAAINAILIQRAFIIAAEVAVLKRIHIASVWKDTSYLSKVNKFIKKFMTLMRSNKTAGVSALASLIKI